MELERHLIVGLGNPGRKYATHRHNIGFMCVDSLSHLYGITVQKRRSKATYGQGVIIGRHVVLAKPQTFMNTSGEAVAPLGQWFKIPPDRILVIYDDLDLDLGKVRVRPGGGSGGHNGIKSIISRLGTNSFPRIRIGIGRPVHGDPVDYVLNRFSVDQEPIIEMAYSRVDQIVRCYLESGVHEAMNLYNGQSLGLIG